MMIGTTKNFGDEIDDVMGQLSELSNSANKFGCSMKGIIFDCWGSSVTVVALPDKRRYAWSF